MPLQHLGLYKLDVHDLSSLFLLFLCSDDIVNLVPNSNAQASDQKDEQQPPQKLRPAEKILVDGIPANYTDNAFDDPLEHTIH